MACSVCRIAGHSRRGHYVACKRCRREKFFTKVKDIPATYLCIDCKKEES